MTTPFITLFFTTILYNRLWLTVCHLYKNPSFFLYHSQSIVLELWQNCDAKRNGATCELNWDKVSSIGGGWRSRSHYKLFWKKRANKKRLASKHHARLSIWPLNQRRFLSLLLYAGGFGLSDPPTHTKLSSITERRPPLIIKNDGTRTLIFSCDHHDYFRFFFFF